MKSRLQLTHDQLVTEVEKQLVKRFRPVILDIEKSIVALVEREYIRLKKDYDRKLYIYVA